MVFRQPSMRRTLLKPACSMSIATRSVRMAKYVVGFFLSEGPYPRVPLRGRGPDKAGLCPRLLRCQAIEMQVHSREQRERHDNPERRTLE